ncbi:hypothetical protein [Devosia sp. Root635]|uniref:hypothetical protein n=1 Tax=Devosia sp. Root635 TaxID=1736575 RepID=UPI0006F5B14E|nr:hypothetical protein [Devosia sp. Root635]KRA42114.1 hypothetical protein ASD80_10335 [Devosia sp. Root635]
MHAPYKPPDFERVEQGTVEERRAGFSSRKFDVIDALLIDPRLKPAEKNVGIAVLQFMSGKTGRIFPSLQAIADNTRLSPRYVQTCLTRLRETNWLQWERGNRQLANEYKFDLTNLDAMLDYKQSMEDGRKERRAERRRLGARSDTISRSSRKTSDTISRSSPDTIPSSDQHLEGSPEGWGIEEQDSQYGTGEGDA